MKREKMERCSKCGAEARAETGSYEFKESGLPVVLRGIQLIRCATCGNVDPVIHKVNQLMRRLALAVVNKPDRLRGEDVRFLRKFLQMPGEQFSEYIRVHPSTLSKWEHNEDPIGEQSDRLIRLIALVLGRGLREELEELEKTVRKFPAISERTRRKIIKIDARTLEYEYA